MPIHQESGKLGKTVSFERELAAGRLARWGILPRRASRVHPQKGAESTSQEPGTEISKQKSLKSFLGTGLWARQPLRKFCVFIHTGHINLILGEAFYMF